MGNFGDGAGGKSENKEKQNPLMVVLDVISGCMAPVIPAIIGAGFPSGSDSGFCRGIPEKAEYRPY